MNLENEWLQLNTDNWGCGCLSDTLQQSQPHFLFCELGGLRPVAILNATIATLTQLSMQPSMQPMQPCCNPPILEKYDFTAFSMFSDLQRLFQHSFHLKVVAFWRIRMQPFATLMQPSTAENATLSLQNGNCINDSV